MPQKIVWGRLTQISQPTPNDLLAPGKFLEALRWAPDTRASRLETSDFRDLPRLAYVLREEDRQRPEVSMLARARTGSALTDAGRERALSF